MVETRLGRSFVLDQGSELHLIDLRSQPGVPWKDRSEKEAVGEDQSGNNVKNWWDQREQDDEWHRKEKQGGWTQAGSWDLRQVENTGRWV